MKEKDKIREQVSAAYARAVSRPSPQQDCCGDSSTTTGCCGESPSPNDCCGDSNQTKGVVVAYAGYEKNDLATIPDEAVANSFGCGNPVAFSEISPGEVVLDLGSGAGIDLFLAAKKMSS